VIPPPNSRRLLPSQSIKAADGTKPAVLVVDDIEANVIALETLLEEVDCEVVIARSGSDALRKLLKREFAVMLLDVQMPEMDGYEVAQHARSSRATREMPIIFLTAAHESEDRVLRGYGSGAVEFLFKPVNPTILRSKVRIFLELYVARRVIQAGKNEFERINSELVSAAAAEAALTARLQRSNDELQAAYGELKSTQGQLIQSAKMASLGELVAGVAHEINNPLGFAISHLATARRSLTEVEAELGTLSENGARHWRRANDRLREMNLGLERVRDLVVKLRTFSRLDEGEWKRVSVRESIESVLTILGARLGGSVEVRTSFGEPDELECYPGPLNQALANLIANAIDAIGPAGTLTIASGAQSGAYEIRVGDTGPGIPEAIRERVLEPFFTTKPVGAGTGLGLSITYSIVKKHRGELELRDAPGGGTLAIIRLPLQAEAAAHSPELGSAK
jgi:two-component system NtrC family sensor kinase